MITAHRATTPSGTAHWLEAGTGPPLVLLHGVPQTSHAWRPVMPALAARFRVIAPDLRGLGDTGRPLGGYDKQTVAADVWALLHDHLGLDRFALAGHDWGGPVAFALAAAHRDAVRRLAILDVTIPGDGTEMSQGGRRWHHPLFRTPDLPEALFAGREALFLDWLFDNYGADPDVLAPADRAEYHRAYARLGSFRATLAYYRAAPQDAADNAAALARDGKLAMPVLALGGDRSFGRGRETIESARRVATDVHGGPADGLVPGSGHWLAEEAPGFVAAALLDFFDQP